MHCVTLVINTYLLHIYYQEIGALQFCGWSSECGHPHALSESNCIGWIKASRYHCYARLPPGRVPSRSLKFSSMCVSAYMHLSFEVDVVKNFVSTLNVGFKCIVSP